MDLLERQAGLDERKKTIQKPVAGWADSRVANLLSRIRSPGLPRCYGSSPSDPASYLFEYLEGQTLRQLPREHLTPSNLHRWFDQVLDALALISLFGRQPFAHLDLSPENIVITGENRACPIDFAASRFLDGKADQPDGSRVMTAGYAAPEIYFGRLCPEADLYSLSMTVLAAYAGKMAAELDGRTIKRIMGQLGRPLAERLRACLSEDPALRRQAVRESLYGIALEQEFRQKNPDPQVLLTESAEESNKCPFQLRDCPFLELADQFRHSGSMLQ